MPDSKKKKTAKKASQAKSAPTKPEVAKPTEAVKRPEAAKLPQGAKPPQVKPPLATLDQSGDGGPFISQTPHPDVVGTAGGVAEAIPPGDDLIVEVELAPGTASIGQALTANTAGFLAGAGNAPPIESAMSNVLRAYNLVEAKPVFTGTQVQNDEALTNKLREKAATGAATPDQVSMIERLPSLSNFIRLRFPPGTPPPEVTAALRKLREVTRAVAVPRATPPQMGFLDVVTNVASLLIRLVGQTPSDPLIGTGSGPIVADANGFESQWYLHRTRVPQAWRYARGAGVVIADIDWGFRTTHQEFEAAIEQTYNAVDGKNNVDHPESFGKGRGSR